jgi:hypothetical protein
MSPPSASEQSTDRASNAIVISTSANVEFTGNFGAQRKRFPVERFVNLNHFFLSVFNAVAFNAVIAFAFQAVLLLLLLLLLRLFVFLLFSFHAFRHIKLTVRLTGPALFAGSECRRWLSDYSYLKSVTLPISFLRFFNFLGWRLHHIISAPSSNSS